MADLIYSIDFKGLWSDNIFTLYFTNNYRHPVSAGEKLGPETMDFGNFTPIRGRLVKPDGGWFFGGAMQKLRLDQVKSGMLLAKDVVNFSGQVLLYKGSRIQPKDIKNFKAWGIPEVVVKSSAPDSSAPQANNKNQIDAKLLVEAQNEVADLFRYSNLSHPVMAELMRLSTLNKLRRKPGMENVNVY
ncbi:MAG: hypothetical protein GWM98_17050 [Nitrospinaceae bacterium]|nr:hypothetical protein [Nitrospinaceae bacterium]NIR55885.1 hypothetical protein [Nitrospinaceae bacterium]NIT83167.1 hypothetical protein [Nitrospinaceae bacterium]NIU45376.1 hypothetical protein [Nitrospinaceae bacterium]NIU97530.1 hypothetical protein [Nitrospinaceae bacterium]